MRTPRVLAACLWLALAGCVDVEPQVSFAYDPELPSRLVVENAAWPEACERSPSERIGLPPALPHEPNPRPVPEDFVVDLAKVIRGLPRPLARLFEQHVCAVVLMHGSPMTGTLMPLAADGTRSIVLLNVDNLNLSPNAWLTYKESSAFAPAARRSIGGTLAEPGEETRAVLLEFVLVHELGHVFDAAFPDHILIDEFKRISWPRSDALADAPLVHYPQRKNLSPLPDDKLEPYLDLIASGPFASPATVSNAKEDFAESLATYTHTVIRRRPWRLAVLRNGQQVRELGSCWAKPRCSEKRRILETLLQRWSE